MHAWFGMLLVIVVEQGSPGLVPSMKSSYVNSYGADLQLDHPVAQYPLFSTPPAVLATDDGLIVAELECGQVCHARLVRHNPDGTTTPIGDPLPDFPIALELAGDDTIVVGFPRNFVRLDRTTGRVLASVAVPALDGTEWTITDFDLDTDGCRTFIATQKQIGVIDLCSGPSTAVTWLPTTASDFGGIRLLPAGDILAGSRGRVYVLHRDGSVADAIAMDASLDVPCRLALDPTASSVVVGSRIWLVRLELATRTVIAGPVQIRNGVWIRSMAVNDEWRAALPHSRPRPARHR